MLERLFRFLALDRRAALAGSLGASVIPTIRGRLAAIHANHKRIARGAVLIAGLTMIAKVVSAAREIAIASRYGISGVLDAYQMAVTITTAVSAVVGSIAAAVLVPRLISVRAREAGRRQFIDELNGTVVAVAIAIALLTWVAAPFASALLGGGAHAERLQLTIRMSRDMAPVAAFTIGIAYFSARLQSRERYAYSVSEAVPAATIMLLVLLPFGLGGGLPLVIGTVAGSLLQSLFLAALIHRGDPPLGSVRMVHRSSEWQSLYGSILLMGLGQLLFATSAPIDQAFAARVGEGAVATLGYANRIVALLTGFGTIVVARALLPVLASSAVEGQLGVARRQSMQWAAMLTAAGATMALVSWMVAPILVRLMFQRGAFNSHASAEVSIMLKTGVLQLPFYFGGMAVVQLLLAARRYRALATIAASAICVKIGLNLLFVPLVGLPGIMIATAGMYAFSFMAMLAYARAFVSVGPTSISDRVGLR